MAKVKQKKIECPLITFEMMQDDMNCSQEIGIPSKNVTQRIEGKFVYFNDTLYGEIEKLYQHHLEVRIINPNNHYLDGTVIKYLIMNIGKSIKWIKTEEQSIPLNLPWAE